MPPEKRHRSFLPSSAIGMVASTGLGYWPIYVLPLLVGQFMESRGYTASQAGLLGSLEIGAIGLMTLGASRFLVIADAWLSWGPASHCSGSCFPRRPTRSCRWR